MFKCCHDYDGGLNDDDSVVNNDDSGVNDDDGRVNDDDGGDIDDDDGVNDDIDDAHLSSDDIIIVIRVDDDTTSVSSNFVRRLFSPGWRWGAKHQFRSIPDDANDDDDDDNDEAILSGVSFSRLKWVCKRPIPHYS